MGWLHVPGFRDLVISKWGALFQARVACRDPIDLWQLLSAGLRRFLKGWGANLGRESRQRKALLLADIQELDRLADLIDIDEDGWALRYHLQDQMVHLFHLKEEYWRQRGCRDWLLKGDANIKFFHAFGNDRRRKCRITSLLTPAGPVSDKLGLQRHIYQFYLDLFTSYSPHLLSLKRNF